MKFKSQLITVGSGKVNGLVASHNRGGNYFRGLSIPVNPNTPFQQAVRSQFAGLMTAWNNTLTDVQRAAWNVYAANVTVTDVLGEQRNLTGPNWYVAMNTARIQGGLARIDDAPTAFFLADLTSFQPTFDESAQNVSVAFDNTEEWATAVGGALNVYMGLPQNPGISFYKGPYRYVGTILGAVVPPTSPQVLATLPFAVAAGQIIPAYARAVTADGRISSPFRQTGPAVA